MSDEMVDIACARVFRKGGGARLTFAQVAKRAIEIGGVSDGHEAPADVNRMTKASVAALTGRGLVAAPRAPA
jgi:xanthine dehydrogenase molybdenum-binding subunit